MYPNSFTALCAVPQFILWKRTASGVRIDKVPYRSDGAGTIDPHNPGNWMSYVDAATQAAKLGDPFGVGFVFTGADPFFFVDLDHCYTPETHTWLPHSLEVIAGFQGACMEWSTSGTGCHIFGTYDPSATPEGRRIQNDPMGVALYTERRFVALTGKELYPGEGDSSLDCSAAIGNLCSVYLTRDTDGGVAVGWTVGPIEEGMGAATAEDAYRIFLSMKSGKTMFDENHAGPEDLWFNNEEKLARAFPTQNDHSPYDGNRADMALATHLAFVTGGNCQMILSMMMDSGLHRDKWDDRPDYLQETITRAVGLTKTFYNPNHGKATVDPMEPGAPTPTVYKTDVIDDSGDNSAQAGTEVSMVGVGLMPVTQQIEWFKGCTYVMDQHRILIPTGMALDPSAFKTSYSGFSFIVDNEGNTTKNAYEAFAESRAHRFPKVATTCFDPLSEPGVVLKRDNLTAINTFVPLYGKQVAGDVEPFLGHVALLVPNETDRLILLDYLAACLQYAGRKFQWCPLVQGVPGNGKTVLYTALEYVLGQKYCHQVDPKDIDNKFNAWIVGRLLCCIEEIRVGGRRDMADALKPLITNSRVPVQGKKKDQTTGDNCANFLMFSNHKDGVLKTADDRRYAVFYTAQQDKDDMAACGMTESYFLSLYDYLRSTGGKTAIAHYLATREISINLFGPAPETSNTEEAIQESGGTAEHIIREAVESEEPGFTGGLIAVVDAVALLSDNGKRFSAKAVASVLRCVGYVSHPALDTNRDRRVKIDGRKYSIYVLKNSLASQLESPESVASKWRQLKTAAILPASNVQ